MEDKLDEKITDATNQIYASLTAIESRTNMEKLLQTEDLWAIREAVIQALEEIKNHKKVQI